MQHITNATINRLVSNAARLGHGSHVVAAAAHLSGETAHSLCCWCAERIVMDGGECARLPQGGECDRCPYVGRDCLVVVPLQ